MDFQGHKNEVKYKQPNVYKALLLIGGFGLSHKLLKESS